jgi:hypothetical protein
MKTLILSALIGLSVVATGAVTASADSVGVHGYSTSYGR